MTWHDKVVRATAQARLGIASSEQVFAELKEYGAYTRFQPLFRIDEGLEEVLFVRNDPLINLGLAQYAASPKIVTALYNSGLLETKGDHYFKALRLACLANEIMPQRDFSPFHDLGSDELQRLAHEGDQDEIEILMSNPSIGGILGDLYNRTGSFANVPDDRFLFLVMMSVGNARINVNEDYDGYDNDFQKIYQGIFNLLRNSPINIEWLKVLHLLLCNIEPADRTSIFYTRVPDLKEIIARWSDAKFNKYNTQDDNVQGLYTSLTLVDEFRCLIAALFGGPMLHAQTNSKDEDPDIVNRCAWYGNASMSPERMLTCWERDGNIFVFSALQNSNMYSAKCRPILSKKIPHSCEEIFKARCDKWGDVLVESSELEAVLRIEEKINDLKESVVGVMKLTIFCVIVTLFIAIIITIK